MNCVFAANVSWRMAVPAKVQEIQLLNGISLCKCLKWAIVSIIKLVCECLEHVNGKNAYVRKEDQIVKIVCTVRINYFFPVAPLGKAVKHI